MSDSEALAALEETSERLVAAVSGLATRLSVTETLAGELKTQQETLASQDDRASRQGRLILGLIISFGLDIALTVAMGLGFVTINSLQHRTSDEVLCPLYGIFIESVNHPRPDQIDTPEKKAAFDTAAETIRRGYAALKC